MSFVDLATLTMHRRNQLEVRINEFLSKCDHAINDIQKLKVQAQSFVHHLNCEPSELKERFLSCMNQLDEFTYLITDFNLAVEKLDENSIAEFTPVLDRTTTNQLPNLQVGLANLMDVLSEPTPSTSAACSNFCPSEKPKRMKVPKEEQLLIVFSSSSSSSESLPRSKSETMAKEVQCKLDDEMNNMMINSLSIQESYNLPAQEVLQTDQAYPATIMSIDGVSFWVITDNTDDVCELMKSMTDFYKNNHVQLTVEEIKTLTYCAFYDDESDAFYRAFLIKVIEEETPLVEVFLVDTGEVRAGPAGRVRPLQPPHCTRPPYARCCHLAGIDLQEHQDAELVARLESFMKNCIGTTCRIEVDDNTSESLGVYVTLHSNQLLNDIIVEEGLALPIEQPQEAASCLQGPPELVSLADSELDITQCPEYEDPVEAVTGYSNRDEADICKHYKGGPDRTCFKGPRCTKLHMLKHPDGWTHDRVAGTKIRSMPLPAPDTWVKVLVTYVCHFDRMFVQFVKEQEPEPLPKFGVVLPPTTLTALVLDMNSPAARMSYKPLKLTPAEGDYVAALYPYDDQWYRAQIITVTPINQNVQVKYIDYGNVVWVKEDQIKVLEPRYQSLPKQAVCCVLAGVVARSSDSSKWASAKRTLSAMTQDRTLSAHVVGRELDELIIELIDEEGYNIAELLAAKEDIDLRDYAVIDDTNVGIKICAD